MATKTLDYYVSETYAKFALPSIKYATVQINKCKVSIQLYAYKKSSFYERFQILPTLKA